MGSITLTGINKVYPDGYHAIRDLDLHVEDGEFVILVGPSGCGKSTVLRMVAGLEQITSGQMLIGDQAVNDLSPKDRDIAMVFQSYALYPHMSVADNMGFALKLAKVPAPEIEARVAAVAATLDLTAHLRRKPKALSGGQRQRVAMGRAIVRSPAVFLMDEPLSNLDAKLRVQMRSEIASLQQRLGATTLYVTHDQVEAMTMGDRVAVLDRGVLQQVDSPQELYERPRNLFVAGFVGSPAMNLGRVQVAGTADAPILQLGEGQTMPVPRVALDRYPGLAGELGNEVVVGMRPEHFVPATEAGDNPVWTGRTVTLVEMLGAEMLVHFETCVPATVAPEMPEMPEMPESKDSLAGSTQPEQATAIAGQTFVARFEPGARPKIGSQIDVAFQAQRLHLFGTDGRALR
jgi:multiple sugar transport system ATP-binding protein